MKELRINLGENSYSIFIDRGLIESIGRKIKGIYSNNKIAIITDKNVDKFYGDIVVKNLIDSGFNVKKIVINPGEKSKSVDVLLEVYDSLLEFGITRGDLIIALGGGVVGDLTGFASATLLRGIPYIQIPTSLLAQIDSSIGGKVAVDLPKGKNLIGNFYHPKAVFIDADVLKTLNKRFFYDGMAEVIKYGCIKDKKLFYNLLNLNTHEELMNNIEDIIYSCCIIKKDVVEKDEKDIGDRMLLNFGHTIGHAIEKYFNFDKYTHGEAVALGMYAITKKSESMNLTKQGTSKLIRDILIKYNLKWDIYMDDKESILYTISLDKKNKGEFMNIVLLNEIGEAFIHKVNKKEVVNFI
ncbi:3-dehydroquinate synthase [Clostridium botulinum]|uniref:3-dehydroquinate synthase n=1 Tax=Clostridium botulinum TaxID=1491 RepID=UPI0004D54CF1|nr:3-dehydroquinate synthase [Clostridium botulinum]KEI02390.1 3-dehydroquinate synthase [Clostridium botulinum C/D str. BKT75002]KEI08264.1 3-dehydroquinate synthase [Clostridium botulinum C/D str. BKT2873]KGM93640.1 3-dehydroquinate synthase [Clostridium botulinum D str. CCUG 7971]KOC47839.1 3-dehydroquinate synthase [Clostridium botulinum]MCD3352129.1 3-dehydroquinate synthase [Clostridium botulinum D/C]